MRLTIIWTVYSLIGCLARPIEDKLMSILKGMTDDQLSRLEENLSNLYQDDEIMQGDMPFPTNDSDSNRSTKERDKKQRLDVIKQSVLLFANRDPNNTNNGTLLSPLASDELQKKIQKLFPEWNPPSSITKVQGYYPSCILPKNTDEEAWQRSQAMNLFFDIPLSTSDQNGSIIRIHAATLKLFKLSQGNTTKQFAEGCSHNQGNCEIDGRKQYIHYSSGGTLDEKQIRVSVYWYTRSLKKHRIKKKLLDSQMMPVFGETWAEFNVKPAINAWRDSGKNFGLTIEVEDEDRVILNALKYFEQMNCSIDASVFNNPALDRTRLFPIIDLATIEFQKGDSVYQSIKYPISENSHRVRHHQLINPLTHHTTEEPSANDSIERIRWDDPSSSLRK